MTRCGGRVNAEWMLPKLLEIVKRAPEVYEATDNFMEVSDYLVYLLDVRRHAVCATQAISFCGMRRMVIRRRSS